MKVIGTAALLLAMQAVAGAQELPVIGPKTLTVFPRGAERCFAAKFDSAYLKAHPGQRLTQFWLYRHFQQLPNREEPGQTPEEWISEDMRPETPNWVDVLARFSGTQAHFRQTVTCSDGATGSLHCFVECDGGSFNAMPTAAGLKIFFDPEYGGRLAMNQGCGGPGEEGPGREMIEHDAGGGFDAVSVPVAQCVAADREARPAYAADEVPLRERMRGENFRCLSRAYDRAHLRKHPEQNVVAIAVAVKGEPQDVREDEMRPTVGVDIRLSVKLRNGKRASRDMTCLAEGYQFRCGGEFRLQRRDASSALLLAGEYGGDEAPERLMLAGLGVGADDAVFRLDASSRPFCNAE